jgi:hypothetical protein
MRALQIPNVRPKAQVAQAFTRLPSSCKRLSCSTLQITKDTPTLVVDTKQGKKIGEFREWYRGITAFFALDGPKSER